MVNESDKKGCIIRMTTVKECYLTGKCINCNGKDDNFMKCEIFIQWFQHMQTSSPQSHTKTIVEEPIYIRR